MCACSLARAFSRCFRVLRASVCIIMADLTPRKRHEEAQSVDDEVRPPSPLAPRLGTATPRKMRRAEVSRKWRFVQGEAHTTSERSRDQSRYSNLSFTQKQRKVERNREARKLTRVKESWVEQASRLSEQEQVQIMQLRSASDQWASSFGCNQTCWHCAQHAVPMIGSTPCHLSATPSSPEACPA